MRKATRDPREGKAANVDDGGEGRAARGDDDRHTADN
jgi:hypothetical protein